MLRTEQILNAKFTPVSKGTYSAEEVDSFLKSVAESYEESLNQNKELIKKISILADKIESYRNDEEAIKLSLLDAHRMAETISKDANEKADAKINDAETRSKVILDGANMQSAQMIEEAREKAKEIVDNARTAVASLTERAQIETENAIVAAQNKAAEIIEKAEEDGKNIIGNSKESYEFYSAELEKVKAETAKFKETIENLCKGQLNLLDGIPESFVAAVVSVSAVEETAAVTVSEEPEAEATVEDVIEAFDADVAEEESAEEAIIEPVEEETCAVEEEPQIVYDPEEQTAQEPSEEEQAIEETIFSVDPVEDEEDDLLSFIDEIEFTDISSNDSIPASLDDLIPSVPVSEDVENSVEEDEFEGFKIDLDSIDGMGSNDAADDEDDIASLFDSLFDE